MQGRLRGRVRGFLTTFVLAGALAASGCGRDRGPATTSKAEPDAGKVSAGSLLHAIGAHHLVAIELYTAGDATTALAHAGHPIEEILPAVEGEVTAHHAGGAAELEKALEKVRASIESGAPADEVLAAVETASKEAQAAEEAVVGTVVQTEAYRGSVVAGLLANAAHEYEESVESGRVSEVVEYQDAYGLFSVARAIYEDLATSVRAAHAAEAGEIDEAFGRLTAAFPGVKPPAAAAAVEDVEKDAALIGHELEETVGARPAVETDPHEVIERIETLLGEIATRYERGESQEAAELAAQAYIEHYERVEGQVIRQAPKINEELEPLLGTQIRSRIRAGAAPAELKALLDRARALLAEAKGKLETHE